MFVNVCINPCSYQTLQLTSPGFRVSQSIRRMAAQFSKPRVQRSQGILLLHGWYKHSDRPLGVDFTHKASTGTPGQSPTKVSVLLKPENHRHILTCRRRRSWNFHDRQYSCHRFHDSHPRTVGVLSLERHGLRRHRSELHAVLSRYQSILTSSRSYSGVRSNST